MKSHAAPLQKLDMPKTALDVLMFLANNPEFNTAGDVCRYRNIKAALVSFHVEKLVEAGFVERQAVKGDRRNAVWSVQKRPSLL